MAAPTEHGQRPDGTYALTSLALYAGGANRSEPTHHIYGTALILLCLGVLLLAATDASPLPVVAQVDVA